MMLFWDSELRFYIAPLLALGGLSWAAAGVHRTFRALQLSTAVPAKNLVLMGGFRAAIVGTATACVALGWLLGSVALAVTAAIIGTGN